MSSAEPTPPPAYSPTGSAASGKKTKAILSVVFGGVSILLAWILPIVWVLLAIAGLILGIVARRSEPAAGKLPLVGIILSIIGIVLNIGSMIAGALLLSAALQSGTM